MPPLTARELAEQGATAPEIAAILGIPEGEAAIAAGSVTRAQLQRVEQMTVARAIGIGPRGADGSLAPHVQGAQFLLANHIPAQYGRQVGGAAPTMIQVMVDAQFRDRERGDAYLVADDPDPSPPALPAPA
jgi:hypothetical protein